MKNCMNVSPIYVRLRIQLIVRKLLDTKLNVRLLCIHLESLFAPGNDEWFDIC